MLRFSLRTLAIAVTAIGLACAALINASPWISSLTWSATVLGLALATVAAVLSTSKRRGFWMGFAIVGWIFTFISISPMAGDLQTSLFTTALLHRAASAMPQAQDPMPPTASTYYVQQAVTLTAPAPVTAYATPMTSSMPTYNPQTPPPPTAPAPVITYPVTTYTPYVAPVAGQFRESFLHVGEALWVLVLGLGGGLLGQLIVARNQARAAQTAAAC